MLATVKSARRCRSGFVFSELALCGYSPEDLLFRPDFQQRCEEQLVRFRTSQVRKTAITGWASRWQNGTIYNALSFFYQGELQARYFKQQLPNYGVFDEKRYFQQGK